MNRLTTILTFIILLFPSLAKANDIANCSNPSGYAYYLFTSPINKKDSGWIKDKISDGSTKLIKTGTNTYDLLFMDSRKEIFSAAQDGAQIAALEITNEDATFIVLFPRAIEIYRFFKEADGKSRFSISSIKGSNSTIKKSSLMVGDCDYLNLEHANEP